VGGGESGRLERANERVVDRFWFWLVIIGNCGHFGAKMKKFGWELTEMRASRVVMPLSLNLTVRIGGLGGTVAAWNSQMKEWASISGIWWLLVAFRSIRYKNGWEDTSFDRDTGISRFDARTHGF
jgi:hypothetical protein